MKFLLFFLLKRLQISIILFLFLFSLNNCATILSIPDWHKKDSCTIYSGVRGCTNIHTSRGNYNYIRYRIPILFLITIPFDFILDTVLLPVSIPFSFAKDKYYFPTVHKAVTWNDPDLLEKLINEGADINSTNIFFQTPLEIAINKELKIQSQEFSYALAGEKRNTREAIGILLKQKIDINESSGKKLLQKAVTAGNLEIVKNIMKREFAIYLSNQERDSLMNFAHNKCSFQSEHINETNALQSLEYCAITSFFKTNDSPIFTAIDIGNFKAAENFLVSGVSANTINKEGQSVLKLAIIKENPGITKLLLKFNANVNEQNPGGETPLHTAAKTGNLDIVKLLINKDADLKIKDNDKNSILHFASLSGNPKVVEIILKNIDRSKINDRNDFEDTPLHNATKMGDLKISKVLISNGAKVNSRNVFGDSPLHSSVESQNPEVVKLLISSGADINARNKNGETPLKRAYDYLNYELIRVLQKHGAIK